MKFSNACVTGLALIPGFMLTTLAIPTWDMFSSREEIGQLVPGTTVIHAFGPTASNTAGPHYLRSPTEPGLEANLTVAHYKHPLGPPSRFFVSRGSLYQITNQTHILYTDLLNATEEISERDRSGTPRAAFKLRLSNQKPTLAGGSWEWVTTMLQFKLGERSNNGLFYKCTETTGETSVYVPLESGRTPDGCEILTLVSFLSNQDTEK
ncbi:hypothetical protein K439DRAFT_1626135 [Ramaria rubella]|nr:hypothetical protein K439DRAFT_1626135 [Ramaria rubella]